MQQEMTDQLPMGAIKQFDVGPWLDVANQLCAADEFERALNLLNNLPAFYRDNPPMEVKLLKNDIWKGLMNAREYITNVHDDIINIERSIGVVNGVIRGQLIRDDVKALNEQGLTPHIVDMGPGEFWMPIGMKHIGLSFTYKGIALHKGVEAKAKEELAGFWSETKLSENSPVLFTAFEVIEHLGNEWEIYQEYAKNALYADVVYLSTPYYTFGGGCDTWRTSGNLGHLRAYTPAEFGQVVQKMFPEYTLEMIINRNEFVDGTMTIRGRRNVVKS